MINALHLLWIIPTAMFLGAICLLVVACMAVSEFDEGGE